MPEQAREQEQNLVRDTLDSVRQQIEAEQHLPFPRSSESAVDTLDALQSQIAAEKDLLLSLLERTRPGTQVPRSTSEDIRHRLGRVSALEKAHGNRPISITESTAETIAGFAEDVLGGQHLSRSQAAILSVILTRKNATSADLWNETGYSTARIAKILTELVRECCRTGKWKLQGDYKSGFRLFRLPEANRERGSQKE